MNPHGTCEDFVWGTVSVHTDKDADTWRTWECWKDSGTPACRLVTSSGRKPPACECHLKERP